MDIFSNILDPIQDSLDPDVFDDAGSLEPRVKTTIVSWVKNKVYNVLQANGYSGMEDWLRLILTGSLTTYQWAEDSDFDVSLWCSLEQFQEFDRAALIKIVLEQLDGHIVPGTTHPLQVFVVDVTQVKGFADSYQAGIRSAFDLDEMKWMVPPERARVHDVPKEYPDVFHSALAAASKMRSLLQYQPEAARAYWKYLHKRRRSDMKAGRGDYADSNIIYKMLHNTGLFDTIQEELGVHISKLLFGGDMVDVQKTGEPDALSDVADGTLVGPTNGVSRRRFTTLPPVEAQAGGDDFFDWDALAREMQEGREEGEEHEGGDPLAALERELTADPTIRDLHNQLGQQGQEDSAEAAQAKYEAFEADAQNVPEPETMEEVKAHFEQHHGMNIDVFKQMMGPQLQEMMGGYDLGENPDIELEMWKRMHKEFENPDSPYAKMMQWMHKHGEGLPPAEAKKIAQIQPVSLVLENEGLASQMEWLDLVLEHGLSVDEIPTDLHTHPHLVTPEELPGHILHRHGFLPNTDQLDAAHAALHDPRRMHFLFNNLSTPDESN